MRPLDAETYQFHDFDPSAVPSYAILSHTWGKDEVIYEDIASEPEVSDDVKSKEGWKKINYTCKEALDDQLKYVWVDTCCIDKRSSAELSEAINSMFAWYQQAAVCYVYLADVTYTERDQLRSARWFTRGWTLQELLAPQLCEFFSTNWIGIGRVKKTADEFVPSELRQIEFSTRNDSGDIADQIAEITGIDLEVLNGQKPLESVCVARRMAWASARQTTRPEDTSYCLLGLFGINMPTIYGEGTKAFQRLQEEIVKSSDDHSLFAWTYPAAPPSEPYGLLAASPAYFANSKDVSAFRDWTDTNPYSVGNLGLAITLPVFTVSPSEYRAFLNCTWSEPMRHRVCLALRRIPGTVNQYQRVRVGQREVQQRRNAHNFVRTQIYLRQEQLLPSASDVIEKRPFQISLPSLGLHGSSTRLLSSYLHTDIAVLGDDWFDRLLKQEVTANSDTIKTLFYLPGERATLSVVLCFETIPERDDDKHGPGAAVHLLPIKLKEMKELRKRQCMSHSRWKKWRGGLKGIKSQPTADESSYGERFLVLVGTGHESHMPVCIPLSGAAYMERLDEIFDQEKKDASKPAYHITYRQNQCHELFEDLSEEFGAMARLHSIHPDLNIRSDVDEVSMSLYNESPGYPLECELQIKKTERFELDSRALGAELDSKELDYIVDKLSMKAAPSVYDEGSDISESEPVSAYDAKRNSWQQWNGPPLEPVLYENVFELPEETMAADEPKEETAEESSKYVPSEGTPYAYDPELYKVLESSAKRLEGAEAPAVAKGEDETAEREEAIQASKDAKALDEIKALDAARVSETTGEALHRIDGTGLEEPTKETEPNRPFLLKQFSWEP